jgi:hypothetical protein
MTTPTFTVTADGIETPRYQDARDLVVSVWKANFGSNSQTASDTPNGQIIDVVARLLLLSWQGTVGVYSASFFRSSSGVNFERLMDPFGVFRIGSRPSTSTLTFYGNDAVLVPANTSAIADDTLDTFATAAAATTSDTIRIVRVLVAQTGTYTVTIDATPYTYAATVPTDTLDIITGALIVAINAGEGAGTARYIGIETAGGYLIRIDGMSGRTLAVTHSVTPANIASAYAVDSASSCTVDGPTVALAGTIRTLSAAVAGIVGLINEFDADAGRNDETDAEMRDRWLDRLTIAGLATPDRIRAAVLAVQGVEYVRVFENESDVVDGDGRPPHCFQVVVLGGADNDIAQAIWNSKPAGILSYGTSASGTAVDSLGTAHVVDFERPTVRYLWLDIEVTDGEGFPTTGDPATAIRDAVVAWANANLTVGSDLYRIQVAGVCTATVPGIAAITVETDDTPTDAGPPVYTNSDITVADDEILVLDSSRVTVTII